MRITQGGLLMGALGAAVAAAVLSLSAASGASEEPVQLVKHAVVAERPPAISHPAPRPVPVDARLLPNLRSLPPEDVHIEVLGNGTRRLRFTSIIANAGIGPVETVPDDQGSCASGQRHASQVIYHDVNGSGQYERATDTRTSSRPAGCMLDHPGHEHWHFDAAAEYALTEPGATEPVAIAEKVSFCWRDNRKVPSAADPRPPDHYGDCSYVDVQGITPGWADVYGEELPDQHLDLPDGLPDGVYCLSNRADPLDLLLETVEDDNGAVRAIEISGTEVEERIAAVCG